MSQNNFNYFDAFTNIIGPSILSGPAKTISKRDYEIFCKDFVFEKLKGKSYGKAFCERFHIEDYVLSNLSDSSAKFHIEKLGYIK